MKKLLTLILSALLLFGIVTPAFAAEDVPAGFTPIRTAEDLNNIRNNLSGKYILMNDIDLSAFGEWVPIGSVQTPFCGKLIGNMHDIRSLTMIITDAVATPNIGLFAVISEATVAGVRLEALSISVEDPRYNSISVGGITGILSQSSIRNCSVSGTISVVGGRGLFVGGIGGWSSAFLPKDGGDITIADCKNHCKITVVGRCDELPVISYGDEYLFNHTQVGGILGGHEKAEILRCTNDGALSVQPLYDAAVGGIAGVAATVRDCRSGGEIQIKAVPADVSCCFGGIAGQAADLQSCVQTAKLSAAQGAACGALLGRISGKTEPQMEGCYYLGSQAPIGENPNNIKTKAAKRTEKELSQRRKLRGLDFEAVWMMENNQPRLIDPQVLPEAVTVAVDAAEALPTALIEGKTENEQVAVIDSNGTVTGISQGETTAALISANGEFKTVTITVKPAQKRTLWMILVSWISGLFEMFKNLF